MLYVVQRNDAARFSLARDLDLKLPGFVDPGRHHSGKPCHRYSSNAECNAKSRRRLVRDTELLGDLR